jgi:hypothetical protein
MKTLLGDIAWALRMIHARRLRRTLMFSQRYEFDRAIRHVMSGDAVIDYPDAVYHVTKEDLRRATIASRGIRDLSNGRRKSA